MLNLFQHPWPGAIQPGWHQLLFAQRHKATNKKAWADRSISPSTVRPATGLQGRAVSRPARRLRGFASLRETKRRGTRSEEHTSELQSLMRISYAVFCLQK